MDDYEYGALVGRC